MNITPVVKQILIGCIVFFAGTYLLQVRGIIDLKMVLAMFYPNSPSFKPWQIITHMFMHGDLTHILFNMLALVSIGTFLERFMGAKKFLQLYLFSGLGAVFIHVLSQVVQIHHITGLWFPDTESIGIKLFDDMISTTGSYIKEKEDLRIFGPVVGASGAIYGVVAAFAYLFPNTELMVMFIPYPIKAKYLVPGFILLDIFLGFSSFAWDPIAHFAHIGGALFGLGLVYYWRKFDKRNFY